MSVVSMSVRETRGRCEAGGRGENEIRSNCMPDSENPGMKDEDSIPQRNTRAAGNRSM